MSQTISPPLASTLFTRNSLFIGGEWIPAGDRRRLDVIDPFTEQVIGTIPEANTDDVDDAIDAAVRAHRFGPWRHYTYAERAAVLTAAAAGLEARMDDIIDAYVHDQGGVRNFGKGVAGQTVQILRAQAGYVPDLEALEQRLVSSGADVILTHEPVGPVLAIVPWNAPLILAVVKIAPALLAGCPVVVKVAPESATVSWILAEVLEDAGVPAGMISFLPAGRSALGDIAARPEFRHVSFTGSTASGTAIMTAAAQNIAGVTLELGGKSAAIILEDLDPVNATPIVLQGSLAQSGQVCTTYSRLLVPASRYDEWLQALTRIFQSVVIGDPDDAATTFGPLISEGHRASVERFIASARAQGATILTGGGRPAEPATGFFVEPTLIADVQAGMTVVEEEIFGPVIVVQKYTDIDDAVAIANNTDFGLAAGVFTNDEDAGLAVARRLEAGNVSINGHGACMTLPFGGYKKSGLGREGGLQAVEELLESKQIQLIRKG